MAFQVGMEGPLCLRDPDGTVGEGTGLLPVERLFLCPHFSLRAQVPKHSLSVPSLYLLVALDMVEMSSRGFVPLRTLNHRGGKRYLHPKPMPQNPQRLTGSNQGQVLC